ncbi:MAG: hypothetical protein ACYSUX_12680, partial [Planctomycetota bacterium]
MYRILYTSFILLALPSMIWAESAHSGKDSSSGVFFDARTRRTDYAGPGREKYPPADVKEVLIGYF